MLRIRLAVALSFAVTLLGCGRDASRRATPSVRPDSTVRVTQAAPVADSALAVPDSAVPDDTTAPPPARPVPVRHLATPATVRGLYVSRAAARSNDVWHLVDLARRTSVNTLVFDVKDDEGHILYPSTVGLAHVIGADTAQPVPVRRMYALMDSLRRHGVYAIARIVVARDPVLAARRPQWGLVRRTDDAERNAWVDARHREVWAYAADLASEAVARGFSEVLFDDVRFPDSRSASERLEVTPANGRSRSQVIRDQLGYLESRISVLDVPMSISVDGMAALDSSDLGTGQRWEMVADHADAVMLRVFPARMPRGAGGLADPGAQPAQAVQRTLSAALRRSAQLRNAGRLIPWYQDFTASGQPAGGATVHAEIEAGYALGVKSWLLWNPESRYSEEALLADTTHRTARPPASKKPVSGSAVKKRAGKPAAHPPAVKKAGRKATTGPAGGRARH